MSQTLTCLCTWQKSLRHRMCLKDACVNTCVPLPQNVVNPVGNSLWCYRFVRFYIGEEEGKGVWIFYSEGICHFLILLQTLYHANSIIRTCTKENLSAGFPDFVSEAKRKWTPSGWYTQNLMSIASISEVRLTTTCAMRRASFRLSCFSVISTKVCNENVNIPSVWIMGFGWSLIVNSFH